MRTDKQLVSASKFLSFVLRHKPQEIGLQLDANGWAIIEELILKGNNYGQGVNRTPHLTYDLISTVVAHDDKTRYAISDDGLRIRANQGHSIEVDLQLEVKQAPNVLYHGTAECFLDSILVQGIVKGSRQYVHLSTDLHTAFTVGIRHGKVALLEVAAAQMVGAGHSFFLSENNVWLTDRVPPEFIRQIQVSPNHG